MNAPILDRLEVDNAGVEVGEFIAAGSIQYLALGTTSEEIRHNVRRLIRTGEITLGGYSPRIT
jgi:hypothetical protein